LVDRGLRRDGDQSKLTKRLRRLRVLCVPIASFALKRCSSFARFAADLAAAALNPAPPWPFAG